MVKIQNQKQETIMLLITGSSLTHVVFTGTLLVSIEHDFRVLLTAPGMFVTGVVAAEVASTKVKAGKNQTKRWTKSSFYGCSKSLSSMAIKVEALPPTLAGSFYNNTS